MGELCFHLGCLTLKNERVYQVKKKKKLNLKKIPKYKRNHQTIRKTVNDLECFKFK